MWPRGCAAVGEQSGPGQHGGRVGRTRSAAGTEPILLCFARHLPAERSRRFPGAQPGVRAWLQARRQPDPLPPRRQQVGT